jgi:hypothetical protein
VPPAGHNTNFFSGRVYDTQAIYTDSATVTIVFAGYNTPPPISNLAHYRTIRARELVAEWTATIGDAIRREYGPPTERWPAPCGLFLHDRPVCFVIRRRSLLTGAQLRRPAILRPEAPSRFARRVRSFRERGPASVVGCAAERKTPR